MGEGPECNRQSGHQCRPRLGLSWRPCVLRNPAEGRLIPAESRAAAQSCEHVLLCPQCDSKPLLAISSVLIFLFCKCGPPKDEPGLLWAGALRETVCEPVTPTCLFLKPTLKAELTLPGAQLERSCPPCRPLAHQGAQSWVDSVHSGLWRVWGERHWSRTGSLCRDPMIRMTPLTRGE